jgi:hypothetical protein
MNDNSGETSVPENSFEEKKLSPGTKRVLFIGIAAVALFLLGFLPMWLKSQERGREIQSLDHELRLLHTQNHLANATIDARRGQYEPARRAAAEFFTLLTDELKRKDSVFTPPQRERLQAVLQQRDDLITLLARSDPASPERLSQMHVQFRQTVQAQEARPEPSPAQQSD